MHDNVSGGEAAAREVQLRMACKAGRRAALVACTTAITIHLVLSLSQATSGPGPTWQLGSRVAVEW